MHGALYKNENIGIEKGVCTLISKKKKIIPMVKVKRIVRIKY